MSHYPWGKKYKASYVCWACRKVFKRRGSEHDFVHSEAWKCPECFAATEHVGYAFEPPARSRLEAWGEIRKAWLAAKAAAALRAWKYVLQRP